jgi:hypothetical protein
MEGEMALRAKRVVRRPAPSARITATAQRRSRGGAWSLLLPILFVLVAVPVEAVGLTSSFGPVAGNPADKLVRLPIDAYAYDRASRCESRPDPGMLALESWFKRNARGSSWGIMRCSRLGSGYSLHAEGRALDWRLNVHRLSERREASRLIKLLLATDRVGTRHALARRMGIQEIIWNCEAWWSGSSGTVRYSACYDSSGRAKRVNDTTAHRDHMHIGMHRRGAAKRTTYWTRGR